MVIAWATVMGGAPGYRPTVSLLGTDVGLWSKDDSRWDLPGFGSVLSALFGDRVQSPLARDAFEFMRSAVLEADPRSGDEILDRARDQDIVGSRL